MSMLMGRAISDHLSKLLKKLSYAGRSISRASHLGLRIRNSRDDWCSICAEFCYTFCFVLAPFLKLQG